MRYNENLFVSSCNKIKICTFEAIVDYSIHNRYANFDFHNHYIPLLKSYFFTIFRDFSISLK